jgi:hypothetical protein
MKKLLAKLFGHKEEPVDKVEPVILSDIKQPEQIIVPVKKEPVVSEKKPRKSKAASLQK